MAAVYITKYALTDGVFECEIDHQDGQYLWAKWPGGLNGKMMFNRNDWHMSKTSAMDRACDMRDAKIASLKKSITRLEKIETFEIKKKGPA